MTINRVAKANAPRRPNVPREAMSRLLAGEQGTTFAKGTYIRYAKKVADCGNEFRSSLGRVSFAAHVTSRATVYVENHYPVPYKVWSLVLVLGRSKHTISFRHKV